MPRLAEVDDVMVDILSRAITKYLDDLIAGSLQLPFLDTPLQTSQRDTVADIQAARSLFDKLLANDTAQVAPNPIITLLRASKTIRRHTLRILSILLGVDRVALGSLEKYVCNCRTFISRALMIYCTQNRLAMPIWPLLQHIRLNYSNPNLSILFPTLPSFPTGTTFPQKPFFGLYRRFGIINAYFKIYAHEYTQPIFNTETIERWAAYRWDALRGLEHAVESAKKVALRVPEYMREGFSHRSAAYERCHHACTYPNCLVSFNSLSCAPLVGIFWFCHAILAATQRRVLALATLGMDISEVRRTGFSLKVRCSLFTALRMTWMPSVMRSRPTTRLLWSQSRGRSCAR